MIAYFDNEDIQECLPYYIKAGLVKIICKGFASLTELYDIQDHKLQEFYDSTHSKGFVRTMKANNITAGELSDIVYDSIIRGKAKLKKPLERWLVIEVTSTKISDWQMKIMLNDIAEKNISMNY